MELVRDYDMLEATSQELKQNLVTTTQRLTDVQNVARALYVQNSRLKILVSLL